MSCPVTLMGSKKQVTDHEVKPVQKMDINRSVSSENSLLAEKSFINGHGSHGHYLEWKDNMETSVSSYNGGQNKVCISDYKFVTSGLLVWSYSKSMHLHYFWHCYKVRSVC